MTLITIFTDGSSRGNPGPGGWGTIVVTSETVTADASSASNPLFVRVTELGGSEKNTTNNKMELTAVIQGLKNAGDAKDQTIKVYTDSSYVINGITKWIHGWKKNGWMTKTKDDVLNKELWMQLDQAAAGKKVSWEYVGGHVGIVGNERCDVIATSFADGEPAQLYSGPLSQYPIANIFDVSHDAVKVKLKKSSSSRSNAKAYSYVSSVGGVIQVHHSWAECEKRVKGAKGARFKKSFDPADEKRIISEFGGK